MSVAGTESFVTNLSWNTRISRTRVSTTDALSLSGAPVLTAKGLDHLLRTIQQLGLRCYSFDELKHEAVAGEGESFRVEKCLYNKEIVAVKHVKLGQNDYHRLQSVLLEIQIMRHGPLRNHPNILSALGYGWREYGERLLPYVVVDYAEHGSLREWLRKTRTDPKVKFKLAGDIATGLKALHFCDIIHGDLKLDNILVVPSPGRGIRVVAKLCDFGHSIILRTGTRDFKYYGTILYNAPEVELQELSRIEPENLHKCDIWAYGLAVWEIFADGARYFKPSWATDEAYMSQTPLDPPAYSESGLPQRAFPQAISSDIAMSPVGGSFELVSEVPDPNIPSHNAAAARKGPVQDPKGGSALGSFSYKHLQPLSRKFVNTLQFPGMTIEKGYLRKLFQNTLQIDPLLRPSQITLVPTMVDWDRSDEGVLQEELALHTGSAALDFEIFRFEQDSEIPWEDKRRILKNLESISEYYSSQDQAATAASTSLQASFCYLSGFGASKNYNLAQHFLDVSVGLGHPMASLFGPDLSQILKGDTALQTLDYTSKVVQGFLAEGPIIKGVELHDKDGALLVGPEKFKNYAALKAFLHALDEKQCQKTISTYVIVMPYSVRMDLLSLAIAMGDVETVKKLANIFIRGKKSPYNDETPLIQACRRGISKMVLALLDAGADPNVTIEDGCTLYHWLFMLGNEVTSVVENLLGLENVRGNSLLNSPCSRTYTLHQQWPLKLQGTPLAFAIEAGSTGTVKALLAMGASPTASAYGPTASTLKIPWTPLHLAFRYHQVEIARLLLKTLHSQSKSSGQISTIDSVEFAHSVCYSTVIERMVMHSNPAAALKEILLMLDPNILNQALKDGQTPFMQAIDFSNIDVVNAMLLMDPNLPEKTFVDPENSSVFTYPAIFAAQIAARIDSSDALEIMQLLLKRIDHKKVKDSQGRTPLHLSVTGCSTLATKWLLNEGFETDALDNNGRAPIHNCATSITLEILLDAGAKPNRADKLGFTPLHLAALQGFEDLVERLIFRDADLTAWGTVGSPLHCAVLKQSWRIAAFLLKADDGKGNKIEINAVDEHGDTALHIAARLARPDLLQLLFAHHIDALIKNKRGFTAKSQFEDLAIKEGMEALFGSRRKSAGSLDSDSMEQEAEAADEKDTKTSRARRRSPNPHRTGRTNEIKRSTSLDDSEKADEIDLCESSDSESESDSDSDEATLANPNDNPNDNQNDEPIIQTAPFSTSTSQEANRECLRAYEKAMKAYQDDIWKRAKHNPETLLARFQPPLSPPERGKPPPAFDFLESGP